MGVLQSSRSRSDSEEKQKGWCAGAELLTTCTELPCGDTQLLMTYTELPCGDTELPLTFTELPCGGTELSCGGAELECGGGEEVMGYTGCMPSFLAYEPLCIQIYSSKLFLKYK